VLFLTPTSPLPTASDRLHSDETAPQQSATQHKCKKRRHNNEKAVAAESRLVHLFVSLFRKKKEARECLDFVTFEKVNCLLWVVLYFGGCRVLGCIVSYDFDGIADVFG